MQTNQYRLPSPFNRVDCSYGFKLHVERSEGKQLLYLSCNTFGFPGTVVPCAARIIHTADILDPKQLATQLLLKEFVSSFLNFVNLGGALVDVAQAISTVTDALRAAAPAVNFGDYTLTNVETRQLEVPADEVTGADATIEYHKVFTFKPEVSAMTKKIEDVELWPDRGITSIEVTDR